LEWWGVSGVEEKDMHESLCRYNQVGPMFQLFTELPNWLFPKKTSCSLEEETPSFVLCFK